MNVFGNYHPVVLFVYFLSILLVSMFVWNPVLQAASLLGGACFCMMLRKQKGFPGSLKFYLPLFIFVIITNPIFSHGGETILFFLGDNPVTLEAFLYGGAIAVMVAAVMLWCKCCSEVMSSDKFLYLFGMAIPKLSLVLSMSLRFIPMFKRQMQKVNQAQKAMGLYSSTSCADRARSGMRVFMAMVAWSMENSMETASSMKARGYGLKGRSNFSLFRFQIYDGFFLALNLLLAGVTLFAAGLGETEFLFYPSVSALRTSVPAWLAYACYSVLAFLPFILQVKESLQWSYYRSKI